MSSYKVGDKFVIEIEEQVGDLFRIKGFNALVFDKRGLNMLRRFEDENKDSIDAARTAGQNEVWEMAKNLDVIEPKEFYAMFNAPKIGDPLSYAYKHLSGGKALEKYRAWKEAKEKEEAEIKAGDVIITDDGYKAVVLRFYMGQKDRAYLMFEDGSCGNHSLEGAKKTSKRIDVESVIMQIREV